jgi:hypothetical protein
MLAEDARWAADAVLSARAYPDATAFVALTMGHHFVRIAYEGALAIRSPNPLLGVPVLADLLDDEFAAITARGRHASKVLDDTKKGYSQVLTELATEMRHHHGTLIGNAVRWARRWETDLGLFTLDDALIGATVPLGYRLGLNPSDSGSISGADLAAVTHEWGGSLTVLGAATGKFTEPAPTLDFAALRVASRDRLAAGYLAGRFSRHLPLEAKLLLLLIEGDFNTSRLVMAMTSAGHEGAVFRSRTVAAYHGLRALQRVHDTVNDFGSPGSRTVQKLLADAPTQRLLSPRAAKIRNRCVHYEMNDPAIVPELARPMFGLIEALDSGQTFEGFYDDICTVTARAGEALAEWTS